MRSFYMRHNNSGQKSNNNKRKSSSFCYREFSIEEIRALCIEVCGGDTLNSNFRLHVFL